MQQDRWLILKAFLMMIALLVLVCVGLAIYFFASFLEEFEGHMEAIHQ
jgi:heme/copper-type cytochrome/quinol oxidase subunit 2